jgi:hypothetical protein
VRRNIYGVSPVIVTRGDVDLTEIIATLPYNDPVVIWDNSTKVVDSKCYGRWLGALLETRHQTVYFQDDDILFTEHTALLAAHRPEGITANMPSPWYENTGYDLERSVQVGAGSLLDRGLAFRLAFHRYWNKWPKYDDDFLTYCDDVAGILCPSLRVDFGYEVLPHASAPGRIWNTPGSSERRAKIAGRALELRKESHGY